MDYSCLHEKVCLGSVICAEVNVDWTITFLKASPMDEAKHAIVTDLHKDLRHFGSMC